MALVPTLVFRELALIKSGKQKDYISITFTAHFSDGSEKLLNKKMWVIKSLNNPSDFDGKTLLHKDVCVLYHKDWSSNPTLGTYEKHYPKDIA